MGLMKRLRKDEKGVSPVIGVILMVAVTVILAAVIAQFVFGMGSKAPKVAPQASLAVVKAEDDSNGDYIIVEHQGGEVIAWDEIRVNVITEDDKLYSYTSSDSTTFTRLEPESNVYFEPGERFKITANLGNQEDWGQAGQYIEVRVIHTETGQAILSAKVQLT